jgi:hypothetical protein
MAGAFASYHPITLSPFETNALPAGTVTILIKAVDNAGNESTNVASAVIGLGDVIVDNVIETIDFKAMGWPGTKTNCHVNSDGDLVADDSGDLFYSSDDAPMYPGNDSSLFYRTTWPAMTYEQEFTPTDAGYLSFDANIDGNAVINYRRENPYAMYGADYDLVYSDDNASMYKTGPYVAYAGKVATTVEPHQIKIEIPSGTVQGIIRSLAAVIDVPDESETLNDIAISASGTRLPIVKSYREIKNVNITLQEVNGVTAYTAKIIDKSTATGPLVKCYNTVGAAVAGVVDAIIQGVKG